MGVHNIIEIKRGEEYRVFVEEPKKICDESKFFYPVFRKSAELISEIVSHFQNKDNNDDDLLETDYHNNIIMYCAERGSGKSSAMCTISNALAKSRSSAEVSSSLEKLFEENISNLNFSVLSPIDPTIISKKDMFMRIILSKMFSKLRYKWEKQSKYENSFVSGNIQDDKTYRNKIIRQFMKCYRYLDVIYQSGGTFDCDDDLEDLTDLGDSGRFKKEFWNLVISYLSEMTGACPKNNSVMVIPIDDADLNSEMAFDIVEDIRKYCIIPNVIILMAVNIEQMHYVLEQHFVSCFKTLIDVSKGDNKETKTVDMTECHKMAMRYVDKVMPAAHQIFLPTVDDFIRNSSSMLTVKYFYKEKEDIHEILDFNTTNGDEKTITDYQELLLRLIYNKTGMALVKPANYLHNILPRTMRGLSHFLVHLCRLPDLDEKLGIAEISELLKTKDPELENMIGKTCAEAEAELLNRIDNLEAFKQYFLKNWCVVRLSKKDCMAIETLENTADELKVSVAETLLDEFSSVGIDTSIEKDFDPPLSPISYAYIQKKTSKILSQAAKTSDSARIYSFIYAVRMSFMLFFNRLVLTCVKTGSFDKLLSNVNLEAWAPFNGKLKDHEKDLMFGRFTINYNIAKKIIDPKSLETILANNVFIKENFKHIGYQADSAYSKDMAARSMDKDSNIELVCDYGTMLLNNACGINPQYRINFATRNALFALLSSYELQRYVEKCSVSTWYPSPVDPESLNKICFYLDDISYLLLKFSDIIVINERNFKTLQLANKKIATRLIDAGFEKLLKESQAKAINTNSTDDLIHTINSIKNYVTTVKPNMDNIITLYEATIIEGTETKEPLHDFVKQCKKITDILNYDPKGLLNTEGSGDQSIIDNAQNVINTFVEWSKFISQDSVRNDINDIKEQVELAFGED